MSGIQNRYMNTWERGSAEEISRASKALSSLLAKKSDADRAARMRDDRKLAFRRGGEDAVKLVWRDELSPYYPNPGGSPIKELRPANDWQPKGKTADIGRMRLALARHMYGSYSTPEFLDAMWLTGVPDHNAPGPRQRVVELRFSAIWKAAASGASVYKECMAKEGLLSRKETHYFLQAPSWCSVPEAIWWARILSMSGSRSMADIITHSRLPEYAGDVLQAPNQRWIAVARFFSTLKGDDIIRGEELADILDWVRTMLNESQTWSIAGRTAATVRRASKEWHKLVSRQKAWSKANWEGFPLDVWTWETGNRNSKNHRIWKAEQILNGRMLAAEGSAQRHCVGSYLSRCTSGNCSIVSLKVSVDGGNIFERALTIELNKNWQVVQARGKINRQPTSEERYAMEKWANANGITISRC